MPDAAGEVALEAADGLGAGLALGALAGEVGLGLRVAAGARDYSACSVYSLNFDTGNAGDEYFVQVQTDNGGGSNHFAGREESRQRSWYILFFLLEGIAEEQLQREDWLMFREWMATYPDAEQAIADFSRPGRLTAALNWYRANFDPSALVSSGEVFAGCFTLLLCCAGSNPMYSWSSTIGAPMRKARSVAWFSTAGFHHRSK